MSILRIDSIYRREIESRTGKSKNAVDIKEKLKKLIGKGLKQRHCR
jgi:hypothetical protein